MSCLGRIPFPGRHYADYDNLLQYIYIYLYNNKCMLWISFEVLLPVTYNIQLSTSLYVFLGNLDARVHKTNNVQIILHDS